MMKRVKIFDNQDDLYKKSNQKVEYQEDENKIIDCGHLVESEKSSSNSGSESSSDSESSEER
jgi:hypothetical protein